MFPKITRVLYKIPNDQQIKTKREGILVTEFVKKDNRERKKSEGERERQILNQHLKY